MIYWGKQLSTIFKKIHTKSKLLKLYPVTHVNVKYYLIIWHNLLTLTDCQSTICVFQYILKIRNWQRVFPYFHNTVNIFILFKWLLEITSGVTVVSLRKQNFNIQCLHNCLSWCLNMSLNVWCLRPTLQTFKEHIADMYIALTIALIWWIIVRLGVH